MSCRRCSANRSRMERHTYLSDDRPDVELPLQDSPPPTPPAAMGRRTADISLQKSDSETHRWVRTGYVVLQSAGYRVLFLLLILSTRRYLRSEEHTSELQSHSDLVCRLLLEKKKKKIHIVTSVHCDIASSDVR